MTPKKEPEVECEGIKQYKKTNEEIIEVKKMIDGLCINSELNKSNLKTMSKSIETLATTNSLTHYKLFGRTEKNNLANARLETRFGEHEKHGTVAKDDKKHKSVMLVSYVAIFISVLTMIVLAKQAGYF